MRKIAVHFPIVIYPSEGDGMRHFTAHCLNLDLLADDDSVQAAVSQLLELIEQQLDAAEEYGADPFRRAPSQYWKMLGDARPVPHELLERVIKEANARRANTVPSNSAIDSSQMDVRELQLV